MKPILLAAILCACFESTAFGYLDPGTGSYFIQIFIAGIISALAVSRIFWMKIKAFISKMKSLVGFGNARNNHLDKK
jgi:hypothetical protein